MTSEEYRSLKAKIHAYNSECERQYPGINCFTASMLATLPPAPRHAEISAIEVEEFKTGCPKEYFAYVNADMTQVTTWPGDVLGYITYQGKTWRSNFGDRRTPIRVQGINGVTYSGIAYVDSGDYCRLRALKNQD